MLPQGDTRSIRGVSWHRIPPAHRLCPATSARPRRGEGRDGAHLRLGGEVLSWFDEERDAVASLSSALFVAQFYPLSSAGLYLKGGLGIGRNAIDFNDGFNVGDTGFAGLLGAGYELRLGRRLYLNPVVDLVGHSYSGRLGGGYSERLVNFGLGVLFQTGK